MQPHPAAAPPVGPLLDQRFSFGGLPSELHSHVYSFLTPITIKTARLLNRLHHEISTRYLIPRAYWALRPKTIEIFNNIVEHPVLRKCVTEIVYDASYFADSKKYLKDDNYRVLYDYQENMMYSTYRHQTEETYCPEGTDLIVLENAVKSLPKLRSIYYTTWYHLDDSLRPWYLEVGPMAWDLSSTTRLPEATDEKKSDRKLERYTSQTLADVLQQLLKGGATIQDIRLSVGSTYKAQLKLVAEGIKEAKDSADGSPEAIWKTLVPKLKSLTLETKSGREFLTGDLLVKRLSG